MAMSPKSGDPIAQLDKPLFGRFGQAIGFLFSSVILAWLLTVVTMAIFELVNRPHPECAVNTHVLPCGYLSRLSTEVTTLTPLPVIPFFLIIIVIRLGAYVLSRHRNAR